ncbi:MAG TPA: PQQ-binding-like beta-propeller repeat protein, partial [Vicinamibacteria bacterium]
MLAFASSLMGQEPRPEPQEEPQETQQATEGKPKGAPRPPEGILPLGEIARLSFAPSDRPGLMLHGNRLVVVTASGAVEAHDADSGEFRWKLGLPGEALFAPIVHRLEPFEILLSSASGRLFVVDAETGEIRSEAELSFQLAIAPLVDLPFLYLGTPDGEVIAFDLEKRTERFRFQAGEAPAALSSEGGVLVASGSERTLIAIEGAVGAERWRFRGRSAFYAPAVFARDRLYIGNDAGDFYCFTLSKGDRDFRWSTGAAIRFAPLVEERMVFVTSFGNNLYAFQARGGTEKFRVSLPGRPASGPVRFGR